MDAIEVAGLLVHTGTVSHPLLGQGHVIEHSGRPLTVMSAIDWERPQEIPAIADPRALPPGSGTLLINEIARRAQQAGVQTLRYAGPYPTHALFASLLRSFRTHGTVELFTADVLDRAVRLARDEVPIDFAPHPFVRSPTSYGFVDRRDGAADRVGLGGVIYDSEEQPSSLARLLEHAHAVLTVGVPIASIASLDGRGDLVEGPRPIPPFTTAANGTEFPQALRDELADAAGAFVPAPLARDVAAAVRSRRTTWEDLTWRTARKTDDGFSLHVGFLALAGHDMQMFAQRISYHLAMIAQQVVLEELQLQRRG